MKLDFHREKRKISLIAFDLDGTLLNSSLQISEFTLSRIRAIAGRKVKITVCSGRIPAFQRLYLAQLDLDGPYVACKDRKSTRLNSSHVRISYAVFCLKKKIKKYNTFKL